LTYGLYLHFPFCRQKCDYCNFLSYPLKNPPRDLNFNQSELIKAYLDRLKTDLDKLFTKIKPTEIDTIYFGGGTPSLLKPKQLELILNLLKGYKPIEISIEINPEDVSKKKLTEFKSLGINRFILGVQTLDKKEHQTLGRASILSTPKILETFFGVPEVTKAIDLITGLPKQKIKNYLKNLEIISSYQPDHFSVYLLSLEKETPLEKREKITPELENLQILSLKETIKNLTQKGYDHYEISNFAKPGCQSKHNLKYWEFKPYIGLGIGAHSFYQEKRYSNQMSLGDYLNNSKTVYIQDPRNDQKILVEYFMTGLRLLKGVSLEKMSPRLNLKIPSEIFFKIETLVKEKKLLKQREGTETFIKLNPKKIEVANAIIYELVESLLE